MRAQLEACASSEDSETITINSVDANWLASDLTHAIVKHGYRDQDVIDLSERLTTLTNRAMGLSTPGTTKPAQQRSLNSSPK